MEEDILITDAELSACTNQLSQIRLEIENPEIWSTFSTCMFQIKRTDDATHCVAIVQRKLVPTTEQALPRPSNVETRSDIQPDSTDIEMICNTVKQTSESEGKIVSTSDWSDCVNEMNQLHRVIGDSTTWNEFQTCIQSVKTEEEAMVCTQQVMVDFLETHLNSPTQPAITTP